MHTLQRHHFMREKVTANQTQTKANQQIAPSLALRAICSSQDRITDGQQRKYDHTSPAADTYLNLPHFCPNNVIAAGRFPLSCKDFTCSAVLKRRHTLQEDKEEQVTFTWNCCWLLLLLVTPPPGDLQEKRVHGCWESAVGGLWNAQGKQSQGQSLSWERIRLCNDGKCLARKVEGGGEKIQWIKNPDINP